MEQEEIIKIKYEQLAPHLNEKTKRSWHTSIPFYLMHKMESLLKDI